MNSNPDFIEIEIPDTEIIHQKLVGQTPPRAHFLYGTKYEKAWQIMKAILSYGLGGAMLVGVLYAYIVGFTLIHDDDYYIGFGVYGSIMVFHLFIQTIFAYANKIRNKKILLKKQTGQFYNTFKSKMVRWYALTLIQQLKLRIVLNSKKAYKILTPLV